MECIVCALSHGTFPRKRREHAKRESYIIPWFNVFWQKRKK